MSARPFPWGSLPKRSKSEAELLRRAAALVPRAHEGLRQLAARFDLEIRTSAALEPALELPTRAGATFTLKDERGARAWVWIDGALVPALSARVRGAEADEIAASRPATAVETGLLAYLVASALEATAAPFFVEEAGGTALPDGTVGLDLTVRAGSARGFIRVYASPAALVPPERLWSDLLLARAPEARVTVRVFAGRARIALDDLARLKPRAVVILDTFDDALFLAVGAGGFPASRAGEDAKLTAPYEREPPMTDDLARDLPIELTCEVARLTLPARDVLALAPGAVISLGKRLGDPVELWAGGRPIARGELVDLEGELGMRVLQEL